MLSVPQDLSAQFNEVLKQRAIPASLHVHYRKWLRYFLDYCSKYHPPDSKSEQVRLFIEKLRSKNQTPQQCKQAAHAVSLFLASQKPKTPLETIVVTRSVQQVYKPRNATCSKGKAVKTGADSTTVKESKHVVSVAGASSPSSSSRPTGGRRYNEWRCLKKTKSPEWDQAIDQLSAEIKTRHYSKKTLKRR